MCILLELLQSPAKPVSSTSSHVLFTFLLLPWGRDLKKQLSFLPPLHLTGMKGLEGAVLLLTEASRPSCTSLIFQEAGRRGHRPSSPQGRHLHSCASNSLEALSSGFRPPFLFSVPARLLIPQPPHSLKSSPPRLCALHLTSATHRPWSSSKSQGYKPPPSINSLLSTSHSYLCSSWPLVSWLQKCLTNLSPVHDQMVQPHLFVLYTLHVLILTLPSLDFMVQYHNHSQDFYWLVSSYSVDNPTLCSTSAGPRFNPCWLVSLKLNSWWPLPPNNPTAIP